MRIAIFGATGFIGQNIVKYFSEMEIDFVCFGRKKSPFLPSINFETIDITNLNDVKSVLRNKDIVIHFASSSLLKSLENPIIDMKTNIEGTLNILETIKNLNIPKIIFASTIALFDRVHYDPVDEKHPCNPKSPYGVSKLTAENYIRVYNHLYGINYVIFRFTNVYGPHQRTGIIPTLINRIDKEQEIELFGDGTAVRDFVFVEDIPFFLLKSIKEPINGVTINFGCGKPTSIKDLIFLTEKIMQKKARITYRESKKGEIENFTVNVGKLKNQLGRLPPTSLEEGLRKTYNWFLKTQI